MGGGGSKIGREIRAIEFAKYTGAMAPPGLMPANRWRGMRDSESLPVGFGVESGPALTTRPGACEPYGAIDSGVADFATRHLWVGGFRLKHPALRLAIPPAGYNKPNRRAVLWPAKYRCAQTQGGVLLRGIALAEAGGPYGLCDGAGWVAALGKGGSKGGGRKGGGGKGGGGKGGGSKGGGGADGGSKGGTKGAGGRRRPPRRANRRSRRGRRGGKPPFTPHSVAHRNS